MTKTGGEAMTNVLYHYTSIYHLPTILETGFLKLTESNLRIDIEMHKPVVWATTTKEPNGYGLGLDGSMVDKTEIRIHLRKNNNFMHWSRFKKQNKHDKNFVQAIEKNRSPKTWWVSSQIIPLEDVLLIENRYTGEIYYKQ